MNGYLLDTNIVLFSMMDDPRLSAAARRAINTGPNFISLASYWEVTIKSMNSKLEVGDLRNWWHQALRELNALPLQILPQYIEGLSALAPIHQDPFDRIMIASAMDESLTLITTDSEIAQYASNKLVVVL